MDGFKEIAEKMVIYQLRTGWLSIAKMYNDMAVQEGGTMSMAFILLTINDEFGTPVTKIAPRMGMEPNSLSRILNSMEKKGAIYRRKDKADKRKVFICLTDYGREIRDTALRVVMGLETEIVKDIDPKKMEAFFEVMEHLPKAIERVKNMEKSLLE
ncbi:MAG: MarR family transcriptional regulator [Thalassobium sp.]|nr:MAG: MarR family transcriptional regulator [Thalassobium sp.]